MSWKCPCREGNKHTLGILLQEPICGIISHRFDAHKAFHSNTWRSWSFTMQNTESGFTMDGLCIYKIVHSEGAVYI